MVYLIVSRMECEKCKQSEKILNKHNIKFEKAFINDKLGLKLVKEFKLKSVGTHIYDDVNNEVLTVSEYLDKNLVKVGM
jgi:hypothetical protein